MLLRDERVLARALVIEVCRVREHKGEIRALIHQVRLNPATSLKELGRAPLSIRGQQVGSRFACGSLLDQRNLLTIDRCS